ncbi:unnamed protein product [Prunus armeniaca]|uniref:Uncharacterized protein n=1 Tax=Prunus armeniaca TaxID=36596 RepID=A0A6J5UT66_PRUAR|nr:unnamed protein product [Prunus armeniaca]
MEGNIIGGIPSCDLAKDHMAVVEEKFKRSDKAKSSSYLTTLTSTKFDGAGSIIKHLLKLGNITDQFLVHVALNSLSSDYEQVKINYNTQKETWIVNELIAICYQEEERLKKGKREVVNLVHAVKGKKVATVNKFGNPN